MTSSVYLILCLSSDYHAPAASVEDVKVGVTHGGPVRLVREVGGPLGQSRHPPVECLSLKNIYITNNTQKYLISYRAGVAPATAVPVEAAGSPGDAGGGRQRSALPVIECHVIHSDVAAGPGRAPDTLNDHLRIVKLSTC